MVGCFVICKWYDFVLQLQVVLESMQKALQVNLGRSLKRYPSQQRSAWLMNKMNDEPTDPAQICLLVAMISFVKEMEETFGAIASGNQNAMRDLYEKTKVQLRDLIKITRTELTKAERQRVMVTITLDAHSRDICSKLVRENIVSVDAFQWQSQLKQRYVRTYVRMDCQFSHTIPKGI